MLSVVHAKISTHPGGRRSRLSMIEKQFKRLSPVFRTVSLATTICVSCMSRRGMVRLSFIFNFFNFLSFLRWSIFKNTSRTEMEKCNHVTLTDGVARISEWTRFG